MAVDVYCYIERREGNSWQLVGELVPNDARRYDPEAPELAPSPILHSVNKELASILVDTGWAIRAAEPYAAIVPRRGKPDDLSPELAAYFQHFEEDEGVVFSWFTAAELNAFDLSSHIITRRAHVSAEAAHLFDGCPFGFPIDQWSQGVPVSFSGWSRDGIEVQWREAYADIVREFADIVPPALAAAGAQDVVRLVVEADW